MVHLLSTVQIQLNPNSTSLPGTQTLVSLLGGLSFTIVVISVLGILLSAGAMAIGNHTTNGRLADRGKTGLVASLVAAALSGGAAAIINFAFATGGKIH